MKANIIDVKRQINDSEYISPSRLRLWLKCPLAYKQRYIDGIIPPTPPKLFLGKMVHAGLEFYYLYRQRHVKLFSDVVSEHIKSRWEAMAEADVVSFTSTEEEESLKTQACSLVTAYLDQVPNDDLPPAAVEQRFEAPLVDPRTGEDLGIPLLGIVDLVLSGSEGPILVDFKTAARSSTNLDLTHELQLSCYSYLLRQAVGTKEQAIEIRSLIKTKTPRVESHSFSPRQEVHFDRLFSVVRAYLKALEEQAFHIRPGLECSYCDYRETACNENELSLAA
jgi:putative RecB family exonuclease